MNHLLCAEPFCSEITESYRFGTAAPWLNDLNTGLRQQLWQASVLKFPSGSSCGPTWLWVMLPIPEAGWSLGKRALNDLWFTDSQVRTAVLPQHGHCVKIVSLVTLLALPVLLGVGLLGPLSSSRSVPVRQRAQLQLNSDDSDFWIDLGMGTVCRPADINASQRVRTHLNPSRKEGLVLNNTGWHDCKAECERRRTLQETDSFVLFCLGSLGNLLGSFMVVQIFVKQLLLKDDGFPLLWCWVSCVWAPLRAVEGEFGLCGHLPGPDGPWRPRFPLHAVTFDHQRLLTVGWGREVSGDLYRHLGERVPCLEKLRAPLLSSTLPELAELSSSP